MKNKIMRRVYYSFALSFFEQPLLYVGLVLGGAVALFGRLTHVKAIWQNFTNVPVGNVPNYVAHTFMGAIERGEFGTVVIVLTIATLSTLVMYQISNLQFIPRWKLV